MRRHRSEHIFEWGKPKQPERQLQVHGELDHRVTRLRDGHNRGRTVQASQAALRQELHLDTDSVDFFDKGASIEAEFRRELEDWSVFDLADVALSHEVVAPEQAPTTNPDIH